MNRKRIRKKIFAFRPFLKVISRVFLKVMPVLRFLILLLKFLVSFFQLFDRGGTGLVVIPVLRFLILVLQVLVSFFQLFTRGKF
jgi:hypothetical protein